MRSVALTPEGRLAAGVVLVAAGVAAFGGSNALAFGAAAGIAVWLVAFGAGWWNLRGLIVHRELPAEIFAEVDAAGTLVVENSGALAAVDVVVEDGTAIAHLPVVGPGVERRSPVAWRFPSRGPSHLAACVLTSDFPFGWLTWRCVLEQPLSLLVFPRPVAGPSRSTARLGSGEQPAAGRGHGDWMGVRPWRDGDSARDLHWPSSARTGEWMVVERSALAASALEVVVDLDVPLERALSVAAFEVLGASGPVGLRLGERHFPARTGRAWKRELLEILAYGPEARPE